MLEAVAALVVPPGLELWSAASLIGLSFVTSALTGALGLGGGLLMLVLLAALLPPAIVIPVHGVVQIGSNVGRASLMRDDVSRALLWPFALGSAAGVAIGALIVVALPTDVLRVLLGLFVLYSVWTPKWRPANLPARAFALVGALSSFVTMFVGATGPLVAAFIQPGRLTRHGVVATHAACMTVQHGFKVAAFTALGFAFMPWLPLLALMIGLGFLGTIAGKRFLDRLPERSFARAFRLVVTALAAHLLWTGAAGWLGGFG